jgi:hypothetical protein
MPEYVSGREIQARVQAIVDADPRVQASRRAVIIPMPNIPSDAVTGHGWTMNYVGQYGDLEDVVADAVETVRAEAMIGGPAQAASGA